MDMSFFGVFFSGVKLRDDPNLFILFHCFNSASEKFLSHFVYMCLKNETLAALMRPTFKMNIFANQHEKKKNKT